MAKARLKLLEDFFWTVAHLTVCHDDLDLDESRPLGTLKENHGN